MGNYIKLVVAKATALTIGLFFVYCLGVFMKCWTPECFAKPVHIDVAVGILVLLAFLWSVFVLIDDYKP